MNKYSIAMWFTKQMLLHVLSFLDDLCYFLYLHRAAECTYQTLNIHLQTHSISGHPSGLKCYILSVHSVKFISATLWTT